MDAIYFNVTNSDTATQNVSSSATNQSDSKSESNKSANLNKVDIDSDFPRHEELRQILSGYQDVLFGGIGLVKPETHEFSLKL